MSLSVRINGRPIPSYFYQGKNFIEGWKGSEYEIKYQNISSSRHKIIVSVDGLNVVSGDTNWEKGYVIEPFHDITIPGWRKDSGNVAKFVFSSVRNSYNQHNEKGDVANVGVIGCKVFNEKPAVKYNWPPNQFHYHYNYPYPGYPYPNYTYYTLTGGTFFGSIPAVNMNTFDDGHSVICAAAATEDSNFEEKTVGVIPQNSVATGWGENKTFETHSVNYEFEPNPVETILFYYDDRQGLQRRGIPMDRPVYTYKEPNAFPDGCPPPK